MTFGILRAAGISLEQLPPDIRARIERFQTTNVEAFRAFSQGLDLKDQGRFVEAKEFFRRAAELDPGFTLAVEQQRAMPDVNLGTGVQARAVVLAAAGAAVDRGKASFALDTARALAAIAAGAAVVAVPVAPSTDQAQTTNYTSNPPGSGGQFTANLVAGYSYTQTLSTGTVVGLANAAEWRADSFKLAGSVLESLGNATDFFAQRLAAANQPGAAGGSTTLADGSTAYWGAWLSTPTASASVAAGASGQAVTAPALGRLDYVYGEATRQMPTANTASFAPAAGAGSLTNPSGAIQVNFATRAVALQNLAFSIDGLAFTGLNGSAVYDNKAGTGTASGGFGGNYSSGSCAGCPAFAPGLSSFNGSFIGRNADGLVFSSILVTGTGGTSAGVQLFKRP
jgi:hypothetical protein